MVDASSAFQDSLPVSSDDLLAQMRAAGADFELYEHIPLRTVEDAKTVQGGIVPDGPGRVNMKNFYLRDRKKRNHLVVLEQDREVDLKALGAQMGAAGLSFGSAERLMEFLGVRPGAVSPLAMVNGAGAGVKLWVDSAIGVSDILHVHPLVNDRTVAIYAGELSMLLRKWGAEVSRLQL